MLSWLIRNYKLPYNKMPKEEILMEKLQNDHNMVLSMLVILLEERLDNLISHYQLSLVYVIIHPTWSFIFDWLEYTYRNIAEELMNHLEIEVFTYVSYIIWIILFQKYGKFNRIPLNMYGQNGLLMLVDEWMDIL